MSHRPMTHRQNRIAGRLLTGLMMMTLAAAGVSAMDTDALSDLYYRLPEIDQKTAVVGQILEEEDDAADRVLADILVDLTRGDASRFRSDRFTFDRWELLVRDIVTELGRRRSTPAAATVWKLAENGETSRIRADALVALGRMEADEYTDEVALMLRDLNFNVRSDKQNAEMEAFGAVFYLSALTPGDGFEPLYYAYHGWYTDRVRMPAGDAVLAGYDDVGERLTQILLNTTDYAEKRLALATMMATGADGSDKLEMTLVALNEGGRYSENDVARTREMALLRKDSIAGLIDLQLRSEKIPGLLNWSIDNGDMDEKLMAIRAMGLDGSEESAAILTARVAAYNERQAHSITVDNEELILLRQLMLALGDAGSEASLVPLMEMTYIGYTPSLIRLADQVIARIRES